MPESKINTKEIKKIILLRNDKIGDMIICSNVFRELKKALPKAEITVVASNSNKPLIEKNKNIDKIITLNYPPKSLKNFLNYLKTSKQIKKEKFDLGIDLRGSFINVFLLFYLGNVKYKIGFYNRKLSKFFLHYAYKKDRKGMHSTVHRIDLLNKALGLSSKNYWPEIATDPSDLDLYKQIAKKNKLKKYIVINPDASLEKKQWSLDKFDQLIKHLKKSYPNYKILLAGSDDKKISYLVKKNPSCIPMINENLRVLYLVLKNSSLVIAQDGGPMHLAWVSKANLIALLSGYLGIEYTKPLGKNSTFLVSKKDSTDSISLSELKNLVHKFLKK
ncbi:hypothetical protein CMI47_15295 [Candidatus Pacearchaeota archaeon]|nr:hypothetical protein [Candidatus Pacearchaeota archaeon]|tara:strand:- start:5969 stop:6964 length:996 start_codon:yes stop_codon:yes gene_type:complete